MRNSLPLLLLALALPLAACAADVAEPAAVPAPVSESAATAPVPAPVATQGTPTVTANPVVVLETSLGDITLELDAAKAPGTVANFVQYVKDGHYDGTVFHRVIKGFMIQGGGYDADLDQKDTRAPIKNEAANGLKNARGTIAMARTGAPHSATAQFFINHKDNGFLDYPGQDGWGYCVFGKVTAGLDVVDKIAEVPTTGTPPFGRDVPATPVLIKKATVQ